MSARDAMVALAAGDREAVRRADRLLGSCRLMWAGAEAFGEEAVLELFRASPLDLADATLVETGRSAALVGDDAALVADLYEGRIGRLWRIGSGEPPEAEPFVAVAFDPDLRQERGHVHFRAEDHPDLPGDGREALLAAGRTLIDVPGAHRARAFAARAFGEGGRAAASTWQRGTQRRAPLRREVERVGERRQGVGVGPPPPPALQRGDRVDRHPRALGQRLLRQPRRLAQLAQPLPERVAPTIGHGRPPPCSAL